MKLTPAQIKELIPDAQLDARKKNMYGTCPKCGHKEFGISLADNHQFGCFRKKKCGFSGNIFTLFKWLKKPISSIVTPFINQSKFEKKKLVESKEKIDITAESVRPPFGFKRVTSHPYLDGRGFVEYEKYKVGTSIVDPRYGKDYIIFLIEQDGEVKGYLGRHIWDKQRIEKFNKKHEAEGSPKRILRYKNSITDFAKLLWGIDEVCEETHTVILVEGGFDKFAVDRKLGLDDQSEVKCCATFKCNITEEQIEMLRLKGVRNIIMLYDPDVIEDIKKNAFKLERYFDVMIGFSRSGRDPDEMEVEELVDVLHTLESPTEFANGHVSVRRLDF